MTRRYSVTGTLSPDATGTYEYAQDYNGKGAYARTANPWYLFWHTGLGIWYLDAALGDIEQPNWYRNDPSPEGVYTPVGTATGTATVTRL